MKWAVWDEGYEGEEASAVIIDTFTAQIAAEKYAEKRHQAGGMEGSEWTVKVRSQGTESRDGELSEWIVRRASVPEYWATQVEKLNAK